MEMQEMQEITPEKENAKEDEGASEAVPEVKTKGTIIFLKNICTLLVFCLIEIKH